jgi:O-antigen/teichoic acid export membrane protein
MSNILYRLGPLITNVKALQAFQVLRQGATILIAIMLAKSSLALEDIGHYELLFYVGFTLTAFWIGGLIQGMLAKYPQLKVEQRPAFLWNAYWVMVGLATLVLMALLFARQPILQFLTGQPDLPYYDLFVWFLWIQAPAFLLENIYLLLNQPRRIVAFGLASFGMQVTAVLVPVFMGLGLYWAFWGLILTAIVKHVWLWTVLMRQSAVQMPKSRQELYWVYTSIPLILYTLIGGLHQSFDNWLVNYSYQGDERIFAIFRYGARELPFALALSGAFGSALLPVVAGELEEGLRQIRDKSRKLFHFLFPLSIGLILINHWLFPLVFSESFEESVIVFNTFLLITSSRLIFSRTVLVGLNENRVVLYISLLELPINIVLSFLLVPHFGLAGIAMGTVVAFTFEKVGLCWYLNYKYRIKMAQYTDLGWFWAYSAALLGSFALSLYI